MPANRDESDRPHQQAAPTSPYGPQRGHVDDAAGGADSSPFETESSDEREEAARAGEPGQKGPVNGMS